MRAFALVVAVATVVILAAGKATAGIDPVKAAQVEQITPIIDRLPKIDKALTDKSAEKRVYQWAAEILPWYAREGIAYDVRVPESINWYLVPLGLGSSVVSYTFDIDAFTNCQMKGATQAPSGFAIVTGPVWMNGHYTLPTDSLYQDVGYIFTLTHELGHDQGICNGPSDYVESSTQLAAIEVASAMSLGGNKLAAASLLPEWRSIILGAMLYDALKSDDLPSYYAFLKSVVTPKEYAARMSKYRARFTDDLAKEQWAEVYKKYSYAVYVKAEWCLRGGTLAASDKRGSLFAPHVMVPSEQPLVMDDFVYLIENLGELYG